MKLWTSKNKLWTIYILDGSETLSGKDTVQVVGPNWTDYPALVCGRVLWDFPERIPKYVQRKAEAMLRW